MIPFFDSIANRVMSGAILALVVALAFVMWRADAISAERDTLETWQEDVTAAARFASGQENLAVDQVPAQVLYLGQGVEKLKGEIAGLNAAAELRAEAFEKERRAAIRETERFRAAAEISEKRVERLQRIARESTDQCEASPELLEALEGL